MVDMMNTLSDGRRSAGYALAVALVLLAGCSSGASSGAGSTTIAGADASTTTGGGGSTTELATTLPATTIPATTTTVAPAPLELRRDGLGPFDFGRDLATVVAAITAQLGAPARDTPAEYEELSLIGEGLYQDFDTPFGFALGYPFGQSVCWTGDFCAEFGGPTAGAMSFIGWSYSGPPAMLASSANLTIGARWSDFPSMEVYPTCYTTGGGTHTGMTLVVEAGTWDWLISDGLGGFVPNLPDPASTRVTFMQAGELPFQYGLDC